jgi:hypothetical protein
MPAMPVDDRTLTGVIRTSTGVIRTPAGVESHLHRSGSYFDWSLRGRSRWQTPDFQEECFSIDSRIDVNATVFSGGRSVEPIDWQCACCGKRWVCWWCL